MSEARTFEPRPSRGWLWLLLVGALVVLPILFLQLRAGEEIPLWAALLNWGIALLVGLPMFMLAAWFPTLRYTLDDEALHLRYGPVLDYRIPVEEIQSIRRRDLHISLWSSLRLPGVALFKVPYADVGVVKMCATTAARRVLLIETQDELYGLSPADEEALVAALKARLEG